MKTLIALGGLISLQISANAAVQCPDESLVQKKINIFSASNEGKVNLNSMRWSFESNLKTSKISSVESLNSEISDLDEHTCNYLIYPTDSNMEDASLTLTVMSK